MDLCWFTSCFQPSWKEGHQTSNLNKKYKKVTSRTSFSVDIEIWNGSTLITFSDHWNSTVFKHVPFSGYNFSSKHQFFSISDFLRSSHHWKPKAILRSSTQRFIRARVKATFLSQETVSTNTTKHPQSLTWDHWACIIMNHHISSCITPSLMMD